SLGDQLGCACSASAARPAVCGAAIDVPDMRVPWLPLPTSVDRMLTPGAATSGLSSESIRRGPDEEKLATCLNVGFAIVVGESVAVPPSAATIRAGSGAVPLMPRNGMVTVYCSPVSGFD